MHNYGCIVIQKFLDNFPTEYTDVVYDEIINNYVLDLSKNQFGNYVIQLILEQGKRKEDK